MCEGGRVYVMQLTHFFHFWYHFLQCPWEIGSVSAGRVEQGVVGGLQF